MRLPSYSLVKDKRPFGRSSSTGIQTGPLHLGVDLFWWQNHSPWQNQGIYRSLTMRHSTDSGWDTGPKRLPCGDLLRRSPCKGGDPAAGSPTATLLRLHPSHRSLLRRLPLKSWVTDFWSKRLPWCDGRCVQGLGTYSPWHADPRLLAIPPSCSRVADCNPN